MGDPIMHIYASVLAWIETVVSTSKLHVQHQCCAKETFSGLYSSQGYTFGLMAGTYPCWHG